MSGGSTTNFTDAFARKKANDRNLDILYSDDYTLLLDIDTEEDYNHFSAMLELLMNADFGPHVEDHEILSSANGRRHAIVKLYDPLPIKERILLQAVLGSDRKRDLLSYIGLLAGQENPVLLFRPKQGALPAAPEPKQLTTGSWDDDIAF